MNVGAAPSRTVRDILLLCLLATVLFALAVATGAVLLIVRPRDVTDNAMPSGSSLAADLLMHLGDLYDIAHYREIAGSIIGSSAPLLARHPSAFGHLLGVIDMQVNGATEVAVLGERESPSFRALEGALAESYVPSLVLASATTGVASDLAVLRDRGTKDGKAVAYVCRGYACEEPAFDPAALFERLSKGQAAE